MKILAFCDSLCEPNPGEMHVGFWAKTDDITNEKNHEQVLFLEHAMVGNGTCNEAEYHGLFALVAKLETVFGTNPEEKPWPEMVIHSDSQLMTKQLYISKGPKDPNIPWKATKPEIVNLYNRAVFLREKYKFTIKWIPREQNAIADAKAQEVKLKGSGLRYTLEDGRFRVLRNTPCVEVLFDTQMVSMVRCKKLIAYREVLEILLSEPVLDFPRIQDVLEAMQVEGQAHATTINPMNSLVQDWLDSTFKHLAEHLGEFAQLAKERDQRLKERLEEYFNRLTAKPEMLIHDVTEDQETESFADLSCNEEELRDYAEKD